MEVVAIVGLGYLGLPLAVAFGKLMPTIGCDLSAQKIKNYHCHIDPRGTVDKFDRRVAAQFSFTTYPAELALRSSKGVGVIAELRAYGVEVFVHDPGASADEARQEYGLELMAWETPPKADAAIVAVAHKSLVSKPQSDYLNKVKGEGCFIDVKSEFDADKLIAAGIKVWRL